MLKLGDKIEAVHSHMMTAVEEMRVKTGYTGEAHAVSVLVFVDGFLQFAGADVCMNAMKDIPRAAVKSQAAKVLGRMSIDGNVRVQGGVEVC